MRAIWPAVALIVLWPSLGWAEWQIKPFYGFTFGGSTTLVDLEEDAGDNDRIFGVSGQLLGEIFGIEGDFGHSPGFLGDEGLVNTSSVTTFTANVVVGLPREWMRYTLRPYIVGGGGAMRVRAKDRLGLLEVNRTLTAFDLGGGATGFLNDRVGLSWELRYFRGIGEDRTGVSFGREKLSFWRASMAVAVRVNRRSR
jgi:hypothetical protein